MHEMLLNVAAGVLTAAAVALVAWLHKSYRRFVGIERGVEKLTDAVYLALARLDNHEHRIEALERRAP